MLNNDDFNNGFDLLEKNDAKWMFPTDIRLYIYTRVKNLSAEQWRRLIDDLLKMEFKPKVADFINYYGGAEIGYNPPVEAIRCGECRKLFFLRTELEEDTECCSECARMFMTDEGRRKLKERRARILANISRMGEMTQVEPDIEYAMLRK